MQTIGFILPREERWLGGQEYLQTLVSGCLEVANRQNRPVTAILLHHKARPPASLAGLVRSGRVRFLHLPVLATLRRPRVLGRMLVNGHLPELTAALRDAGIATVFSPALYIGRPPGLRVLTWLPDFQHRDLPQLFSPHHRVLREVSYRLCIRASDLVILSSNHAHHRLRQMPADHARAPVAVVPFSPTLHPLPKSDVVTRLKTLGVTPGFLYLPNQFWKHKNHDIALRAAEQLQAKGWTGQLVLTGQDFDHRGTAVLPGLSERIADLTAQGRLKVLGTVPRADVLALLQGCAAMINPSFYEGRSTTVEEALMLGTPLLLSDIDIHREQAGSLASYFDPRDVQGLVGLMEPARPTAIRTTCAALGPNRRDAFLKSVAQAFFPSVDMSPRHPTHGPLTARRRLNA